jgi:hypothetical protein
VSEWREDGPGWDGGEGVTGEEAKGGGRRKTVRMSQAHQTGPGYPHAGEKSNQDESILARHKVDMLPSRDGG